MTSTWEDVKERAGELRRDIEFDMHRRERVAIIGIVHPEFTDIALMGDREDVREAYHTVFGTP